MVGESFRGKIDNSFNKILTPEQLDSLLDAIRLMQQALTLEADHDFKNLQGRKEYFHQFVTHHSSELLKFPLPVDRKESLSEIVEKFRIYSSTSHSMRRRMVIDFRRALNRLAKDIQPQEPISPPQLRHQPKAGDFNSLNRSGESLGLHSPISILKGIGPKISEKLSNIGILTIYDLLHHFPRDYVDYSALRRIETLKVGETSTIVAKVRRSNGFTSPKNRNLSILELQLEDQTGRIKVTRFFAGRRFARSGYIQSQARLFSPGATVAVSGLVKQGNYGISFHEPLIEVMENPSSPIKSENIGRLMPVYSLTEGLKADRFRNLIKSILPVTRKFVDPLPLVTRKSLDLLSKSDAMFQIHKPDCNELLKAARRRLVFDEFFYLQLGFLMRRSELRRSSAPTLSQSYQDDSLVDKFFRLLPFSLTSAQERVLSEIYGDISGSKPMSRLLQGDVGSGKTVIAIAALLEAVQSGWQGAFMAPTEVLAQQHYKTLCRWLPHLHVTVELLTGSSSSTRRRQVMNDLANGSLKILVGTHALIEDSVNFSRLGLVVVDEQHRFGVHQRNLLLHKGLQPHLLTMTATPIPRTLALSIHGDLDVSQIDEMPPGRTPVETRILSDAQRHEAYKLIREEVSLGQKVYVVLPLVEDSEKVDLRSAVMVHKELSNDIFPDLHVGLLHGRMKSIEKKSIIEEFATGSCQVLVSTTVVEVGVDVPEASLMVIEDAGRFGLAQLHQLRGRVGRGSARSYCLLINTSSNSLAKQRLEVLVRSTDGFEIAEIDLRLRGPGQVLGTRQSGLPDFALASLANDGEILSLARENAKALLEDDPRLVNHPKLHEHLKECWLKLSGNTHLN